MTEVKQMPTVAINQIRLLNSSSRLRVECVDPLKNVSDGVDLGINQYSAYKLEIEGTPACEGNQQLQCLNV